MKSKKEFIYQVFPKTFNDSNGDGQGDLKGINLKIPYLKTLGITKIWITPFFVSNFKDSGYDVIDYFNIDKSMGTMEEFEELIEVAEENNIGIIIDMVLNHSSSSNNWFKEALKGNEKYKKYYYFKKNINNNPPTNWKSKMGGSSWEYVENLNEWYLHLFDKEQPDLNWSNPEVRNEVKNILNFWLSKGIKGFRFDVCNLYSKPKIFEDDLEGDGRRFYTDGELVNEYFKFMNTETFGKQGEEFLTVGEISSTTKEKSIEYVKKENKELNLIFNFHHLKIDYKDCNKWTNMKPDLVYFKEIIKEWQIYYQNNNCFLSLFLNNHDQPRAISRFGNTKDFWYESGTSIAMFMYLMRGTPFIYQGEEIGMTNYNFNKKNDFFDVETIGNRKDLLNSGLNPKEVHDILMLKARDHSRTAMQWNKNLNAGFSKKEDINILVNDNYKIINVEDQISKENSMLSFYKKIINLKLNDEIFQDGKIEFIDFTDKEILSYKRYLNNKEYLIIVNLTSFSKKLDEELINNFNEVILNNYEKFYLKEIKPYQGLVLKLNAK